MAGTRKPSDKSALDKAIAKSRRAFVVVGVFSFFLNLLYLVSPIYMLQVYDRVLGSGRTETLFYLTIIALAALVVFGILEALRTAVLSRVGTWLHSSVGDVALGASMRSALAQKPVGAQGLRDLQQVQTFLGGNAINPFFDAPWTPIFVVIIWMLHPALGVMALASAVALFLIALLNEAITRAPLREAAGSANQAFRDAERVLSHSETVQAMGMLPEVARRWRRLSVSAQDKVAEAAERGGWVSGLSRFVRLAVQVGILGLGALFVLRGELTAGGMIAGSILLGRALAPVEQSINAWRNFVGARLAHQRLNTLLKDNPEPSEGMTLPPPTGALTVENLFVRVPNSEALILKGVQVDLAPGEALAVVGPSAAGKSTLCRAIVGVVEPVRGCVRLDGADVLQWPRSQFGAAVGYLPQTVELFAGTIRENIARLAEGDPEAVVRAAQLADVHEMILQLPDGYETMIGPDGANLSGGQRQRIGLARAIYGDPKLIVLDEPNSNLDQTGEIALIGAIEKLKQYGATIVIVAHRQSALSAVDKVLVLNSGAVDVFDTRDNVIKILEERRRFSAQQRSSADAPAAT